MISRQALRVTYSSSEEIHSDMQSCTWRGFLPQEGRCSNHRHSQLCPGFPPKGSHCLHWPLTNKNMSKETTVWIRMLIWGKKRHSSEGAKDELSENMPDWSIADFQLILFEKLPP